MKKILVIAFVLIAAGTTAQPKKKQKVLDEFIDHGMELWQIPGLSVVIVKDGETTYKKGFGLSNIKSKNKVNTQTLFPMASTTKAFIAMSLGMLVDDGKLEWDDKVVEHYPKFKLSDPFITGNARIRDLLTHSLGIGGDGNFTYDEGGMDTLLEGYSHAPITYPIRGGWSYQNVMYVIAGEVIEEVTGMHWSEFVEKRILEPLEMKNTTTGFEDLNGKMNCSTPYFNDIDDGVVQVKSSFSDLYGAAGSMNSCVDDIEIYLHFLLNHGSIKGDTLLKSETFEELFKPQVLLNESTYPSSELTDFHWASYGLGWFQNDYHGKKLDFHTGSLHGNVALCALVRDEGFGFYVFANLDHAEFRHALMYKAIDLFVFEDDNRDWNKEIYAQHEEKVDKIKKYNQSLITNKKAETKPSLSMEEYVGNYKFEVGLELNIVYENGGLVLKNRWLNETKLEHYHYDTFLTSKNEYNRIRFLLNFSLNAQGVVESATIWGREFNKINK